MFLKIVQNLFKNFLGPYTLQGGHLKKKNKYKIKNDIERSIFDLALWIQLGPFGGNFGFGSHFKFRSKLNFRPVKCCKI